MKFPKLLTIGLLSLSAMALNALPSMARPGSIDFQANLRSGPSMNADRIDGLPEGTPLEVLKIVPGTSHNIQYWYYVRSTGNLRTEGWVTSSLVRFEVSNQNYGTLAGSEGDVINIRVGPYLNSRIAHTGTMGDLVQVGDSYLNAGYRWYNITYSNGASGWVRGDLINVWPQGCIITCPDN